MSLSKEELQKELDKTTEALETALKHIDWLADDSRLFQGTDAQASAKRTQVEIKNIMGREN